MQVGATFFGGCLSLRSWSLLVPTVKSPDTTESSCELDDSNGRLSTMASSAGQLLYCRLFLQSSEGILVCDPEAAEMLAEPSWARLMLVQIQKLF